MFRETLHIDESYTMSIDFFCWSHWSKFFVQNYSSLATNVRYYHYFIQLNDKFLVVYYLRRIFSSIKSTALIYVWLYIV